MWDRRCSCFNTLVCSVLTLYSNVENQRRPPRREMQSTPKPHFYPRTLANTTACFFLCRTRDPPDVLVPFGFLFFWFTATVSRERAQHGTQEWPRAGAGGLLPLLLLVLLPRPGAGLRNYSLVCFLCGISAMQMVSLHEVQKNDVPV